MRRIRIELAGQGTAIVALALILGGVGPRAARAEDSAPVWAERYATADPVTGEIIIHPECFFHSLLDRYRALDDYGDRTTVTRVSVREGEPERRTESSVEVMLTDGRLDVVTPGQQARSAIGLDTGMPFIPVLDRASMAYKLWIAPHMTLKFDTDAPEGEASAPEAPAEPDVAARPSSVHSSGAAPSAPQSRSRLHATEAERVVIEERELVHLELRSGERGSADADATYDLYVNPESMLVERIDGEERLPDGATMRTTVEITPMYSQPVVAPGADADLAPTVPAVDAAPVSMRGCPVG